MTNQGERPFGIISATAHATFDKGAAYLGFKVHEVPVDPVMLQVNLRDVRRAMFVLFNFHS